MRPLHDVKLAILHQAQPMPPIDGIIKPMKENGYRDSCADIAFALKEYVQVVLPGPAPDIQSDQGWSWPDTTEGITAAMEKGANAFWLNTVLFKGHAIEKFYKADIEIIGQRPEHVQIYEDKWKTAQLLAKNNIPTPRSIVIEKEELGKLQFPFSFPVVVKPIRGRGSHGVKMVVDRADLDTYLHQIFENETYGTAVQIEEYLAGQEITVTVLPPGDYKMDNQKIHQETHWTLPVIKRYHHVAGIAPYSGKVAVSANSSLLDEEEAHTPAVLSLQHHCSQIGEMLSVKAPIRVDGRMDADGVYRLFDIRVPPITLFSSNI